MSQTGAETEPAGGGGSGDGGVRSGGVLKQYNPFKWTIRAFEAGGINQWEEYALDALFAVVLIVFALGLADLV